MTMYRVPALVAASLLSVPVAAQALVADVNQLPASPFGSYVGGLSDGATVWFTGQTPDQGAEPWVTDGTVAGTRIVRDLAPGIASSNPQPIAVLGNRLVFSEILAGGRRRGPWITDGTALGTRPIGNLVEAQSLFAVGQLGGREVFGTIESGAQNTLWIADPAADQTTALAVVNVRDPGATVGQRVVFAGADQFSGAYDLWSTDGTPAGTGPLFDLPGPANNLPRRFVTVGNVAYFLSNGPGAALEVWSTDGTAANTVLVSATGLTSFSGIESLAFFNGRLLLVSGRQLWSVDPVTGTVTALSTTTLTNLPLYLLVDASGAFWVRGAELWSTDGTPAGTSLVTTFATPVVAAAGPLLGSVFIASVGAGQLVVTKTDGTPTGTSTASMPTSLGTASLFALAGNGVVVAPGIGSAGFSQDLWFTDGTPAGTQPLAIQSRQPGTRLQFGPVSGSYIQGVSVDGVLHVGLDDGVHGVELWRTDGSAAGTARLTDLKAGFADSIRSPSELVAVDGALFYVAESDTSIGLWHLPAGAAAPVQLYASPLNSWPRKLQVHDHEVYFRDYDPSVSGFRVFRTDGSAAPVALPQVQLLDGDSPYLRLPNGVVLFEDANGELSRTDGTVAGTFVLAAGADAIVPIGDRAVVLAATGTSAVDRPYEVLTTDGTVANTELAGTYSLPLVDSELSRLQVVRFGGRLVLFNGSTLLRTDGTRLGTAQAVLPLPANAGRLVATADAMYCVASEPATGRELWRTLGTAASTVRVTDLVAGPADGVMAILGAGSGRRLLLSATDGVNGLEPWISDGTGAGTTMLADLAPQGSSNPLGVGVAGELVYFLADDGVHGLELFAAPLGSVGNANVESIGVGCGGASGDAELALLGTPLQNALVTYELSGLPASGAAVLALGARGTTVLPSGCAVHLGAIADARFLLASPSGDAALALVVPQSPALIGGVVVAQAGVFDPAGQAAPGLRLSNAVQLVIGL